MTYGECVIAAANNAEFVSNWLRLRGFNLPGSPIERLVDEASGHGDHIASQFLEDVYDLIFCRLPPATQQGDASRE